MQTTTQRHDRSAGRRQERPAHEHAAWDEDTLRTRNCDDATPGHDARGHDTRRPDARREAKGTKQETATKMRGSNDCKNCHEGSLFTSFTREPYTNSCEASRPVPPPGLGKATLSADRLEFLSQHSIAVHACSLGLPVSKTLAAHI